MRDLKGDNLKAITAETKSIRYAAVLVK